MGAECDKTQILFPITNQGEKMSLTTLSIHHFRGLQSFESNSFSRITLLGGKNNCGKSSVLEAAFYLSGMSNPKIPVLLNDIRAMGMHHISSLYPLFYANDTSNSITIQGTFRDKVQRLLTVDTYVPEKMYVSNDALPVSSKGETRWLRQTFKRLALGHPAEERTSSEEGTSLIEEDKSGDMIVRAPRSYREQWNAVFDSSRKAPNTARWLERLAKLGKMDQVLTWLKSLEPRVTDIRHLEGGEVLVQFDGIERPLPIQVMGDGMIKSLTIAAESFFVGDKGLVCIDEIENGLHYSTIERVWSFIVERAKEGTQFMITTHNKEVMKRLAATQDLGEDGLFSYLNLYREKGDIVRAYPYSWLQFVTSLDEGMEIR